MSVLSRRLARLEARTPDVNQSRAVVLFGDMGGRLGTVDFSNGGPGDAVPDPVGYRAQRDDETAAEYVAALEAVGIVVHVVPVALA